MTLYLVLNAVSIILVRILPVVSMSWVALVSAILVYKLLIEDAPSAPRQRLVAVQVGSFIISYGSKGVF